MEILIKPNGKMMTLLGEPSVLTNIDYRFMKYCLITDIDDGKLIFNGLSRALIFLRNDELELIGNVNQYEFLYKNYFLVPEEFNEQKVTDEIRLKLQKPVDSVYLDHPVSFTILTTTKCNARCFYCYELKSKHKHHMSEETALKVADYITKVAGNKNINLQWFGGEPLFNLKVIDTITQIVRDRGYSFTSSFTTNGYLFDKDLVLKAKNIWNTQSVQITVDGTESVYNKAKNYIYKNVNPYKKVLNNIAILLNNGIQVTLRLNLDFYNCENLKELSHEIHSRFENHPKLDIYAWPIFEMDDNIKSKDEHIAIFEKLKEVEELLISYNYFKGNSPKSGIAYFQCMADEGNSVLITPDGDLGTCEHFIDSYFWGNVTNPENKNFDNLHIWRLYEKPLHICDDCPLYPSCIRPSVCKEMGKCDEQIKEWKLRKHTLGMLNAYKDIKGMNFKQIPNKLNENVN
jgi:radical SAM protein with 4Fe4S-binding SPASM domain